MGRKCYILVFSGETGEVTLEKGRYVDQWIIQTKNRILIRTVKPRIFKGKELFICYEGEPHPIEPDKYFPNVGYPITGEAYVLARQLWKMRQGGYNFTGDEKLTKEVWRRAQELSQKRGVPLSVASPPPKHIDHSPHAFSEEIIRYVISQKEASLPLRALLSIEGHSVLKILVYLALFIIGLLAGIILNAAIFKI
ncbi:MAG: hypothetical protein NDP22_04775 [Crenarchaeota archaeon]|nr:hypothetical protein [Thermoproteota archaeon]